MAVVWRSVNRDAFIHEPLTDLIYIVDSVGEMAEVSAFIVFLGIPVMCELNLSLVVAWRCEEDQGEPALLTVVALKLSKAEFVAVKIE